MFEKGWGWLKRKSIEKSISNIIGALTNLSLFVARDSAILLEITAVMEGERDDKYALIDLALKRKRTLKDVVSAQEELLECIRLSSLERVVVFNEVIEPAITNGVLSETDFPEQVLVASYRVCQAACQEEGIDLRTSTSDQILIMINEAGDLYT